jgi:hypothetical protein
MVIPIESLANTGRPGSDEVAIARISFGDEAVTAPGVPNPLDNKGRSGRGSERPPRPALPD